MRFWSDFWGSWCGTSLALATFFFIGWLLSPYKKEEKVYEDRYIIIRESDIEGIVVPCPMGQNWRIQD